MSSCPKLRIEGFTDAWEQRKFGDTVVIERGGSPRPIDKFITDDEKGLNWVKIGDAPEHGNYITRTAEKIKPEGLSKTREVHPGDLILSNSMSFGKPYIMGIDGCIHDGWLLIRDKEKNFDLKFLCILLGTDNMLNQYKSRAAGSTVNNLNKELVSGTIISYPSMKEQIRIGQYFDNLDNLITLHQRKSDALKNAKKYFLKNMFPSEGEKLPKLRLEGFTDAWEQRKFGEITTLKSASRVHKDEWTTSGVPFYRSSDVMAAINGTENEKAFISEDLYEKLVATSGKLEQGDVLITGGGSIGNPYIVPDNKPLYTKDADLLWVKNNGKFDAYFLYEFFFSPSFRDYLYSISHVGTIAHYTITQLSETPIKLPNIEEQKKIGNFFRKLDNLITLHQRKCDALKNAKKFFLQNMFV